MAENGENKLAKSAFEMGQYIFLQIFIVWMVAGLWSLDEMGSIIVGRRNLILEVAAKLAPVDSELFVNAIIRWKSLYTEFNALAIRIGLRSTYVKTHRDVFRLQKEGKVMDEQAVLEIATKHKEEENKLVKSYGPMVMNILFRHCYQPIQRLIEKDEVVLEYCYLACKKEQSVILCGVVVIRPEEKPLTLVIDFSKFDRLVIQWLEQLHKFESSSEDANRFSYELCDLLFPPKVRDIIEDSNVKRIFLCPDLLMPCLPLDIIRFPDNEMLYQKCAITLLSSSREILRGGGGALLEDQIGLSHAEGSRNAQNPITASESDHCLIFANPNFNLETSHQQQASVTRLIEDILGILHVSTPLKQIDPLPFSEEEANNIELIFSSNMESTLRAEKVVGDNATITAALNVQSPFLLHFATHAFSEQKDQKVQLFGGNFWASTTSGLLLAGANTFLAGKYSRISGEAGAGQLTGLAVCAMNLRNTRLVYLSACSSSKGQLISGESPITLAHAFRAAGAQTIIATLWPVSDMASSKFSSLFYSFLCKRGVHPSEALAAAKLSMQEDSKFNHWQHWAPYVCIGCDFPLFLESD